MFQFTASFISKEFQDVLDSQIFLMANWKWLALVAAIFFVFFANKFFRILILNIKKRIRFPSGEKTFVSYFIQQNLERGLSWILASLIGMMIVENLQFQPNLEKYLLLLLKVTLSLHVLRLAYFAADASGLLINNWSQQAQSQISDQLAPLATKALKVFVMIVGSLIILQNFGVNVTALLAGLGLGGVALAFAAQDTVANLFGTLTILLDSPFKIGDYIKVADLEGTIEEVGFRSTRIRTLHNSVLTLPNSTIAKEKIDNLSLRRGVCRFRQTLKFTYNATPEQIEIFCAEVEAYLKKETRVQHDRSVIQFSELAESSMNVLIIFHFYLQSTEDESELLQKYLLDLVRISQNQKMSFAFPTRTLFVENKNQP